MKLAISEIIKKLINEKSKSATKLYVYLFIIEFLRYFNAYLCVHTDSKSKTKTMCLYSGDCFVRLITESKHTNKCQKHIEKCLQMAAHVDISTLADFSSFIL